MLEPHSTPASIVLDLTDGLLRIDGRSVPLRPKTWEVLCALIERSGQFVTKDDLLDRPSADAAVSEGILRKSVGELRVALNHSKETPSFIETVPRSIHQPAA